jgi:hypothetical protein
MELALDTRKPIDATAISLMTVVCLISGLQQIGLKATATFAAPALQIGLRQRR